MTGSRCGGATAVFIMGEWYEGQGDFKEIRRLKKERDAVEGQAKAKRRRTDGEDKR